MTPLQVAGFMSEQQDTSKNPVKNAGIFMPQATGSSNSVSPKDSGFSRSRSSAQSSDDSSNSNPSALPLSSSDLSDPAGPGLTAPGNEEHAETDVVQFALTRSTTLGPILHSLGPGHFLYVGTVCWHWRRQAHELAKEHSRARPSYTQTSYAYACCSLEKLQYAVACGGLDLTDTMPPRFNRAAGKYASEVSR